MVSLPPAYESRAAVLRIQTGLENAGASTPLAEWAARTALSEAPFAAPTEAGWLIACRRARVLTHNRRLEKPNAETFALNYPADGVGGPLDPA